MSKKIILDCDPGHDDAVAIMLAAASEKIEILGITCVGGNSTLENTQLNALKVCSLIGKKDIKIYAGAGKPIEYDLVTAAHVHGKSGLDIEGDPIKIDTNHKIEDLNAIDFIIKTCHDSIDDIYICPTGPLTNIAKVFDKDPSTINKLKSLYIMGGIGEGKGNITHHAEFNFWVDPDAADVVLNSNIKVHLIAWDTTQIYGYINKENFEELEKINSSLSQFSIDIQQKALQYYKIKYNEYKIDLADPLAMAAFIDSKIVTEYKNCEIKMILNGLKRGKDIVSFTKKGNIKLASKISREKFLNTLKKSLV